MPVLLDSHVRVPSSQLFDMSTRLLHLRSKNITGLLYLVFGYLFACLIATINQKSAVMRVTLKSFIAGTVFAAAWAILEFICKIMNIPYPAMIFNTGTSYAAMGYMQRLQDFPRLSSVAVEPSIFAQTLLVAIALYLPFIFGSLTLFGKTLDRWLFALLLAILCLSTSSTGYVGLVLMVLTILALLTVRGVFKLRHLVGPLAGLGIGVLIYKISPTAQQVLNGTLLGKSHDYSAFERFMTIHNAFQIFLQHPILGIGWSSIDSYDLIGNLLGNTGILGLLSFTIAMYCMFRLLYRSIRSQDRAHRTGNLFRMDFAVYIALMVGVGTAVLSGFPFVFAFFWFLFGLTIPAASIGYHLDNEANSSSSVPLHPNPVPAI
jgi:O-antigen ligase